MAGPTGLEPATSGVTGRHSNQLNYDPVSVLLVSPSIRFALAPAAMRHSLTASRSRTPRNLRGGRWGIRTRDPLRVKQALYP